MAILHCVRLGSTKLRYWLCQFLAGSDGDQSIPGCTGSGECLPQSNISQNRLMLYPGLLPRLHLPDLIVVQTL